jgi:hypothetical protein
VVDRDTFGQAAAKSTASGTGTWPWTGIAPGTISATDGTEPVRDAARPESSRPGAPGVARRISAAGGPMFTLTIET